jgi:hypothetical protein
MSMLVNWNWKGLASTPTAPAGAVAAIASSSGLLAPTRGLATLPLLLPRPTLTLGERSEAIESGMS